MGPRNRSAVRFDLDKIQDSGGRHFEIHINGYNSAVIAHISTKFDADTGNDAHKIWQNTYLQEI